MSSEKMREEFEEAIAEEAGQSLTAIQLSRKDDSYSTSPLIYAWWAWQASRAAIEVDLPSLRSITMGRRENEHDSGFNAGVELCIDAIESIGLKVKP